MRPSPSRRAGAREFAAALLAGAVAWALAGPRSRGPERGAADPRATNPDRTIPARSILPAWHPHLLPGEGWARVASGALAPGAPGERDPARIAGSAPRMVFEWFGPPDPASFDAVVRMRSARAAEVELSLPHAPGWTRAAFPTGEIEIPIRLRTEHPSEVLHLEIVATRPEKPPALELIEVEMSPIEASDAALGTEAGAAPSGDAITAPATLEAAAPVRAED